MYTDKDSQQDFLEWVQEEGCMPTTKEVQEVRKARSWQFAHRHGLGSSNKQVFML